MFLLVFFEILWKQLKSRCRILINEDDSLHDSISEQDWDAVDRFLLADSDEYKKQHVDLSSSSFVSTVTISDLVLHYACRFNAPLRIIKKLSTKFPSSILTTDDDGRYPIHVAVASGCKPDVIRFLIETNPASAGLRDKSGKTSMHYAGECYAKNFTGNHSQLHHNTLRVVELLLEAAPQSINAEDDDEMNPIERALLNATSLIIIKRMQRASMDNWRKRETEKHKSHVDKAKDVQGRSSPAAGDLHEKSPHLSAKTTFGRHRHALHHLVGASAA